MPPRYLAQAAPAEPRTVADFRLLDHRGISHRLHYYSDAKAIVIIAQGNGCPIARLSVPTIRALRDRFSRSKVAFFMINANSHDNRSSVAAEADAFGIDVPILMDATQEVAKSLGLTRTAEALLIDPAHWSVLYRGAIDDQFDYGTRKPQASENYLADALAAFLGGKSVPRPEAPVKGCLFNFGKTRPVQYARDVAPILKSKCLSCHARDGAGPFFSSYEQIEKWAPMIRETVMTGRMPPWHADAEYGKFSNDISLSREESRTLFEWIEAGARRGEGKDPLLAASARPAEDWPEGKPDIILSMEGEQAIPAAGIVPFRTIPLGPRLDKDLWLRSVSIKPGNKKVVHHATLLALPKPISRYAKAPTGKMLIDLKGLERTLISRWVPGLSPVVWPDSIAGLIRKGSYPALNVHYQTSGKPETDRTQVGLYLYKGKKTPRQLKIKIIASQSLKIPPDAKEIPAKAEGVFDREVSILAFHAHMHNRGSRMRFTARYPDGRSEVLLSVPHYDFNWQRIYRLAEPKTLPAGTKIIVDGTMDNSAQNPANPDPTRWVYWGLETKDEMFMGYIQYVDNRHHVY